MSALIQRVTASCEASEETRAISPAVLALLGPILTSLWNKLPCFQDKTPTERRDMSLKRYNRGKGSRTSAIRDLSRKIRRSTKARGEWIEPQEATALAIKSYEELKTATDAELAELSNTPCEALPADLDD